MYTQNLGGGPARVLPAAAWAAWWNPATAATAQVDERPRAEQPERPDEPRPTEPDSEAEARPDAALASPIEQRTQQHAEAERNVELGTRAHGRQASRSFAEEQANSRQSSFRSALQAARDQPASPPAPAPTANQRRPDAVESQPTATAAAKPGDEGGPAPAGPQRAGAQMTAPLAAPTPSPSVLATPIPAQPPGSAAQPAQPVVRHVALLASQTVATAPSTTLASARTEGPAPRAAASQPITSATARSGSEPQRGAIRSASPASETPATDSPDESAEVGRLARLMRLRLGETRQQATLQMNPAELGNLRVHLDLRRDELTLRVHTSTDAAHRLLSEEIDDLRAALERNGLRVQHVEIVPPQSPQDAGGQLPDTRPDPQSDPWRPEGSGREPQPEQQRDREHAAVYGEAGADGLLELPESVGPAEMPTWMRGVNVMA